MIRPVVERKNTFVKMILEDKVVSKTLYFQDITINFNYLGSSSFGQAMWSSGFS